MAAAATQACSDRPAHAGSDRDCNSNEIARCLLLLTLAEPPAAVDAGGVDPVAPPRRRRSKQEKELLDSAAARCSGCADGSAAVIAPWCSGLESDGTSWNLPAAGRCVSDPPDAGVRAPFAHAPPPSAVGCGATCCVGARCRGATEATPHDVGAGSGRCATDRSRRPSSSAPDGCEDVSAVDRAAIATDEGAAASAAPNRRGDERLGDEQRLLTTPSARRLPCDGCPAAAAEPAPESCDERSRPPDYTSATGSSRDYDSSDAAAPGAAYPPGQTVVVLRRKTQQLRTADVVARRRSSRLSQNKRVSVSKIGAASSTLAEKAASLRQKFISLKARTKGMQQKDTEIKVKFQDLQKRRNVLKSLSRSSVVRASKLGSVLLELGGGGGGAGALV